MLRLIKKCLEIFGIVIFSFHFINHSHYIRFYCSFIYLHTKSVSLKFSGNHNLFFSSLWTFNVSELTTKTRIDVATTAKKQRQFNDTHKTITCSAPCGSLTYHGRVDASDDDDKVESEKTTKINNSKEWESENKTKKWRKIIMKLTFWLSLDPSIVSNKRDAIDSAVNGDDWVNYLDDKSLKILSS